MLRAVTFDSPGDPSVLHVAEVADPPDPGPGEVLLDVAATAVNRADLLQRMGFYDPPPGASDIIGLECSGRVAAVGAGVDSVTPGREVCALLAGGGYASKVLVPAGQVMPVPGGVSLVEAAALPEVASTVWSNLLAGPSDRIGASANLADGETPLVHGGGSGIGTMAIQLVRALRPSCRIAVTAGSAEKLERCRALGAHIAINYRHEDFVAALRAQTDGGADVILDNMGAKYLQRNVDALALGGRVVVIGMQGGTTAELNLGTLLSKRGSVIATSLRGRPAEQKARVCAGVVREVWPAVSAGRIKPIIERTLPLEQAAEAHEAMDATSHVGKLVLTV